jgi:uncharacterized membrane protein YidH (DUF202 family)
MATLFYFPIYKFDSLQPISIGNNFLAIILVAVNIILSLLAVFNFKKRKNQISLCWLNILTCIGLLAWLFYSIDKAGKLPQNTNISGYYWIGSFIPLVVIILLFLAKSGIKKDEKIIKAADRLR